MKKLVLLSLAAAVLVFLGWKTWYASALKPVSSDPSETILVKIPQGSSTAQIAQLLEEEGVIRSARAFARYVKGQDAASKLQAGSFALKPSRDAAGILSALTGEARGEAVVTVPEGYTVKDIDALMAEKGLLPVGAVTECARTCAFEEFGFLPSAGNLAERGGRVEGYLFPDTYFVLSEGLTAEDFLSRLLGVFRERVVTGKADEIRASGRSLHEIVTMATLVEEETRTDDERPTVAGILWKRYDEGIGLGVDAAVRYILDKPTATITAADLDVDSAYNLRKYRGLPPGPIANAGIDSINAALKPESSPYYYYLHGNDGQIRYARTNDEHNANRARYLN